MAGEGIVFSGECADFVLVNEHDVPFKLPSKYLWLFSCINNVVNFGHKCFFLFVFLFQWVVVTTLLQKLRNEEIAENK